MGLEHLQILVSGVGRGTNPPTDTEGQLYYFSIQKSIHINYEVLKNTGKHKGKNHNFS